MTLYYWLRYPILRGLFGIPTHLTRREKVTLFRLAARVAESNPDDVRMLEVGSYLGASSSFLAAALAAKQKRGRVFCIDTWENDSMSEGKRDTMQSFLSNTEALASWIVPVRGWSTKVVEQIARHTDRLDLLFIDGDHSYEAALGDWLAYSPLLAPGAVVLMHDIGWAEGVQRVVSERIRPFVASEGRLPNLWWGQMKQ